MNKLLKKLLILSTISIGACTASYGGYYEQYFSYLNDPAYKDADVIKIAEESMTRTLDEYGVDKDSKTEIIHLTLEILNRLRERNFSDLDISIVRKTIEDNCMGDLASDACAYSALSGANAKFEPEQTMESVIKTIKEDCPKQAVNACIDSLKKYKERVYQFLPNQADKHTEL